MKCTPDWVVRSLLLARTCCQCQHQCIFHALQGWHRQLKEIYGSDYPQTQPEVVAFKADLDAIFQAKTKRTGHKRHEAHMAVRNDYVTAQPQVASLIDSLERHWPKLVNGIESTIIPRTNNAVELVTHSGPL